MEHIQKTTLNLLMTSRNLQFTLSKFKIPPIPYDDRTKQAEENLNLIFLTPDQRIIANDIAKEMAGMIPFSDFVIRGFLWRAIREWQIAHKKSIASASRMNRTEQLQIGIEILNYAKPLLSRASYIPDRKLKKQFIDEIMRVTSEYYEELLSVHSFFNNPDNHEQILDFEKWPNLI